MKRDKEKIGYPWWVSIVAMAIAVLMVYIRL